MSMKEEETISHKIMIYAEMRKPERMNQFAVEEIIKAELATLRTKAEAYEKGFHRWAVYSEQMSMVGPMKPSPDAAMRSYMRLGTMWTDKEMEKMWEDQYEARGYTCRKVKVCEVSE